MSQRNTRDYRMRQVFDKASLRALESLCTAEEPPRCTAECPIHLDARGMMADVASGNLPAARQKIEKATAFAYILAERCSSPCREKCILAGLEGEGEGIDTSLVESYVLAHSDKAIKKSLPMMAKKKSAVVFGDSLFSLACAAELAQKAYPVKLVCESLNEAQAHLAMQTGASAEAVARDWESFQTLAVNIEEGRTDANAVQEAFSSFDVVAVSPEILKSAFHGHASLQ